MITLRNVDFRYQRMQLFESFDIDIAGGGLYGLLGRNGAGKTTLLRLISGLLKPDSGEIRVLEMDPGKHERELLQDIFLLPEEFELPPVNMSAYVRAQAVFYPRFSWDEFEDLIHEFAIPRGANLPEMSFGEKKKFAMAFALAAHTRLLILDEPTNAMDIPSKAQFRRILAGAADQERTIILSTHQVRDVENLIDPVIILDEGRTLMNASAERISELIGCEEVADLRSSHQAGAEILFSEPSPRGYRIVRAKKAGDSPHRRGGTVPDDGVLDWELIFQAAIAHPGRFREIFNTGAQTAHVEQEG
ncbi:MAG: ATP-binding cassette domain-containing protein [Spirochaeta sp.]